MIMEYSIHRLSIKELDAFLNELNISSDTGYDVHLKNSRFEIITLHHYPSIYLIRNIVTGTLFSPSKDLQYQIKLVRELSNEI